MLVVVESCPYSWIQEYCKKFVQSPSFFAFIKREFHGSRVIVTYGGRGGLGRKVVCRFGSMGRRELGSEGGRNPQEKREKGLTGKDEKCGMEIKISKVGRIILGGGGRDDEKET